MRNWIFYVGFAQMCENETFNQALINMDKRTNQKACKKSRTSFNSTQSKKKIHCDMDSWEMFYLPKISPL